LILILEEYSAALGSAIEEECALRGLESLRLTRQRIVHEVGIDLRVGTQGCGGALSIGGRNLPLLEVEGVYCSLDSFPPTLWPDFSPEDAAYAAKETHAIWLALLSSLSCRPVNPPVPEALGGAVYSPVELFLAARESSLHIPMTACMGLDDAMALVRSPIAATLCDLGCENQQEKPLGALSRLAPKSPWRHVRIRERLPGPRNVLCVVGGLLLASTWPATGGESEPLASKVIPTRVVNGVHTLHAKLGLVLAEYHFVTLPNGDWILDDYSRTPNPSTWMVHSKALVPAVLESMLTQDGIDT
jgi:hypothetical protein